MDAKSASGKVVMTTAISAGFQTLAPPSIPGESLRAKRSRRLLNSVTRKHGVKISVELFVQRYTTTLNRVIKLTSGVGMRTKG